MHVYLLGIVLYVIPNSFLTLVCVFAVVLSYIRIFEVFKTHSAKARSREASDPESLRCTDSFKYLLV